MEVRLSSRIRPGARAGRHRSLVDLLIAAALLPVVAVVLAAQWHPQWPLGVRTAIALLALLGVWAIGLSVGVREGSGRALEERARWVEQERVRRAGEAVAAERARISRELHDVVAHSLVVIVRQAEGGRFAAVKRPKLAVEALSAVATTGRQALADMRSVLGAVTRGSRPQPDSRQPTWQDVPTLVEGVRASGLGVRLVTSGKAVPMEPASSLAAYRVVQESLTNVVKHAGGSARAVVRLDWRDVGLDVAVTDDGGARAGRGGRTEAVRTGRPGPGQGLRGMGDRVALVGGRLRAGPRARRAGARGFSVEAHLPTRSRASA